MGRKLTSVFLAAALLFATVPDAKARRLLQDGAIEAHVLDGAWCGDRIYVEVRAPSRDSFAGNAFQIRRLAAILSNILPLECPQAREMDLVGSVSGVPVWHGTSHVGSGDFATLPPPGPDDLLPLDERQRISESQRLLNELGYDAGPADGLMGPRTRAAIQAYQQSRGLPAGSGSEAALIRALRRDTNSAANLAVLPEGLPGSSMTVIRLPGEVVSPQSVSNGAATGLASPGWPSGPGGQIEDIARNHGLVVVNGRIAVSGGFRAPDDIGKSDLRPLLQKLALRASPEITSNDDVVFALFNDLTIEERRRLVADAVPSMTELHRRNLDHREWRLTGRDALQIGLNEFEIQRILQGFRTRVQPRLISEATQLPLPILIVCGVHVDRYDFTSQRFELGMIHTCDQIATGLHQAISVIGQYGTADFPTHLSVSPDEAEQLRRKIEEGRVIYAGIEAAIAGISPRDVTRAAFELDIALERIALYEDRNLQRKLHQVELADETVLPVASGSMVDPSRIVAGEGRTEISRAAALLGLAAKPDIVEDQRTAYRYIEMMSVDQRRQLTARAGIDYDTTLGEASSVESAAVALMDEFTRRRFLNTFRTEFVPGLVASSPRFPLKVLMHCDVSIGEYDFDRSLFPFTSNLTQVCDRIPGLTDLYDARVPMTGMPAGVAVPVDEAQAFKDAHLVEKAEVGSEIYAMSPMARLGIELSINGVTPKEGVAGSTVFELEVEPEGLVMFSAADPERITPVRRLDFRQHHYAAVSAEPIAPPAIDHISTALLLMLREGLFEPSQEEWRQWAAALAKHERTIDAKSWSVFFGDEIDVYAGRDVASMLDDEALSIFQEWTRNRAANLPMRQILVTNPWSINETTRQSGKVPALPKRSQSTNRILAEQIGIPEDHLYILDLGNHQGWPAPAPRIALVLPAPVQSFDIPFDPSLVPTSDMTRNRVSLEVDNPRRMRAGTNEFLVVDAMPVEARLVTSTSGEEIAHRTFEAGTVPAVATVEFPPEGYLAVLHAELTGDDPVERLYKALDYRRDAFERRQRAESLIATAKEYDPGEDGFWLVGNVQLAEYDFSTQRFPARTVMLDDFARSYGTTVTLYAADNSEFDVRMPPDQAQEWQRNNPTHPHYALRARMVPKESPKTGTILLTALEIEILGKDEVLTARDPSRILYSALIQEPPATSIDGPVAPEVGNAADPDGTMPDPSTATFDILGISLGDDLDQATESLIAELDNAAIYRADQHDRAKAQKGNLWDPFNAAVMVRSSDGMEAVTLYNEPPADKGRITAIARWVEFGETQGPPVAALKDLLVKKYGEPLTVSDGEDVLVLAWHEDIEEHANAVSCRGRLASLRFADWPVDVLPWQGPDGAVTFPSARAKETRSLAASAFVVDDFIGRLGRNPTGCQETVIASIVTGVDGRALRILTSIANPEILAKIVEKNRQEWMGGTASDAVTEIDLKL